MKRVLLALAAMALLPGAVAAPSKQQDIETLLEAMQLDKSIEISHRRIRALLIRDMRARSKSSNPAFGRLIEEEYDATFPVSRLIADVRPKVEALYDERFSQDEIRELTRMYSSPLYLKFRDVNRGVGRIIVESVRSAVKAGMGDLMKRVTDRAIAEGLQKK